MKKSNYIILFIFGTIIYSQSINEISYLGYSYKDSINYHTKFSLGTPNFNKKQILFRLDFYNNSIIDYNQKFKDNNFLFLYSMSDTLNGNMEFGISAFLENNKVKPIYSYSTYYNNEFEGFGGDIEKSYIKYNSENFIVKVGRDYFLPGKYLNDRLLFSTNGDPYDQFLFTLVKEKLSVTSYYLKLNDVSEGNVVYKRHINGHRINLNLNNGYIALNEIGIYGGENKGIHFPLLNPFNMLYVYQLNNNFNLNSILSLEYLFENDNYHFFLEFILDDFQIEEKESGDLEPTEFGFLIYLNKKINNSVKYNFSYTLISNRTFNVPFNIYEKMIYKNFPIGHNLGNNFWKFENGISLSKQNHIFSIRYIYLEKGEEALFSNFNTDYLNYDISEGYEEAFPFGEVNSMSGLIFEYYFIKYQKLSINSNVSYWFESYLKNEGFNFSISAEYLFEIKI